jgi:hypothetical protein
MSALFHVLTDVNRSNSFLPDFSCPAFTDNEDEIGMHKHSGRSFQGQVMERTGGMAKQMGTGGLCCRE